ncbi:TMV resistance protein N-like [Pistacia vera]|uniref:TMV resistance protein N-like n=1 Tax=Pistacia vera TaxID=55513 RepID=UPI0012631052|nr:TMV resistance protein N-like [Pistacia vera]
MLSQEPEKVLESKNKNCQIVMLVFYNIDPSYVRKQNGTFREGFAQLKDCFMDDSETLQRWRTTLKEAGNISGFDAKVVSQRILRMERSRLLTSKNKKQVNLLIRLTNSCSTS